MAAKGLSIIISLACLILACDASELTLAIRKEDEGGVKRAMAKTKDISSLDPTGRSPLFYAVVARRMDWAKALLAKGAVPDVPKQAASPLWAAAAWGDLEMVKLLLSAGADPAFGKDEQTAFHAAAKYGKTDILQAIFDARPDAKLKDLWPGDEMEVYRQLKKLVLGDFPESARLILMRPDAPATISDSTGLLYWAASRTSPDMELIRILLSKQCNPWGLHQNTVMQSDVDTGYVTPRTPIEWAVFNDNQELLDLLLSESPEQKASKFGSNRLSVLAAYSGKPSIIQSLKPLGVDHPEEKPDDNTKQHNGEASWLLEELHKTWIPRTNTKPSEKTVRSNGPLRVAVIGGKACASESDLLAAGLAEQDDLVVLERDDESVVLSEQQIDRLLGKGETALVADRLDADLLLLVTKIPGGVLRIQAVDVATGLPSARQHLNAREFDPQRALDTAKDIVERARDRWTGEDSRPTAVTVLGVNVTQQIEEKSNLTALVTAGLMQIIDTSPGMMALTRRQMLPVIQENNGSSSPWQAAWGVEAGVRKNPHGDSGYLVTLRLRNLKSGKHEDEAFELNKLSGISTAVGEAWTRLWERVGKEAAPGERRSQEPELLLREVEWRMAAGEYREAAALADAAVFLGAADRKQLRVEARLKGLPTGPAGPLGKRIAPTLRDARALGAHVSAYLETMSILRSSLGTGIFKDHEGGARITLERWLRQVHYFIVSAKPHLLEKADAAALPELTRLLDDCSARYIHLARTYGNTVIHHDPPVDVSRRYSDWYPKTREALITRTHDALLRKDRLQKNNARKPASPADMRIGSHVGALRKLTSQLGDGGPAMEMIGKLHNFSGSKSYPEYLRTVVRTEATPLKHRREMVKTLTSASLDLLEKTGNLDACAANSSAFTGWVPVERYVREDLYQESLVRSLVAKPKPTGELLRLGVTYRAQANKTRHARLARLGSNQNRNKPPIEPKWKGSYGAPKTLTNLRRQSFKGSIVMPKGLPPVVRKNRKEFGKGIPEMLFEGSIELESTHDFLQGPHKTPNFLSRSHYLEDSGTVIWFSGLLYKSTLWKNLREHPYSLGLLRMDLQTGECSWHKHNYAHGRSGIIVKWGNSAAWIAPHIGVFDLSGGTPQRLTEKFGRHLEHRQVAVVGDTLYVATMGEKQPKESTEYPQLAPDEGGVLAFRRGGQTKQLVELGRRPTQSRLDVPDIKVCILSPEKEGLLIAKANYNGWWEPGNSYAQIYCPSDGTWMETTNVKNRLSQAWAKSEAVHWNPEYCFKYAGRLYSISARKHEPGLLFVRSGKNLQTPNWVPIRLRAKAATTQTVEIKLKDDLTKSQIKTELTLDEYIGTCFSEPRVLGIADNHLIIAAQDRHLSDDLFPLLWRVPVSKIVEGL